MTSGDDPTAHQVRLALVLAEELHFGRAAARLFLTQPALSQQIRSLEQRLGVDLFTRTSRKVELTERGRALLPELKAVVDANSALRAAARRVRRGTLRLGVCEGFAALTATRQVIASVAERHPGLGPDVHVADDFTEQLAMLADGVIDAAFVHLPVPDGLRAEVLTTEPRLVCVAATDPLADRPSLTLADLAGHPVVGLAADTFAEGRAYWAADPRPDGSPVRHTDHRATRFESLLAAVALHRAIAFVPASAATLYPRPDLRYLPVEDLPGCAFGLVWRDADHDRPKIAVLAEVARDVREAGAGVRSR